MWNLLTAKIWGIPIMKEFPYPLIWHIFWSRLSANINYKSPLLASMSIHSSQESGALAYEQGPDSHLLAWRASGCPSSWRCSLCRPRGDTTLSFLQDVMAGPGCSDYRAAHKHTRNLAAEQPEEMGKKQSGKEQTWEKRNWEGTKREL